MKIRVGLPDGTIVEADMQAPPQVDLDDLRYLDPVDVVKTLKHWSGVLAEISDFVHQTTLYMHQLAQACEMANGPSCFLTDEVELLRQTLRSEDIHPPQHPI